MIYLLYRTVICANRQIEYFYLHIYFFDPAKPGFIIAHFFISLCLAGSRRPYRD